MSGAFVYSPPNHLAFVAWLLPLCQMGKVFTVTLRQYPAPTHCCCLPRATHKLHGKIHVLASITPCISWTHFGCLSCLVWYGSLISVIIPTSSLLFLLPSLPSSPAYWLLRNQSLPYSLTHSPTHCTVSFTNLYRILVTYFPANSHHWLVNSLTNISASLTHF